MAGVEIVTWNTNQWVSWDDTKTLKMKVDYANNRCLGGLMVWAIDLDDGTLIQSLSTTGRPVHGFVNKSSIPYQRPCFGANLWPDQPNGTSGSSKRDLLGHDFSELVT